MGEYVSIRKISKIFENEEERYRNMYLNPRNAHEKKVSRIALSVLKKVKINILSSSSGDNKTW